MKIIFITLVSWPYGILSSTITLIFLSVVTMFMFLSVGRLHGIIYNKPLFIFTAIALIYFSHSLVQGVDLNIVLAQSNHFFQFFFFYILFLNVFRHVDVNAIASKFMCLYLAIVVLIIYFLKVFGLGLNDYSGVDLNYFALILVSLVYVNKAQGLNKLVPSIAIVLFTFCIANRTSFLLFSIICFTCAFVHIRNRKTLLSTSFLLLATPIVIAYFISYEGLYHFYQLDYNTAIRIEFIRSALSMMEGHEIVGVGFGPSYRDVDFDYLINHGLLTDASKTYVVSNHHSILDTYLRLGILGVFVFIYSIYFYRSNKVNSNMECFLILSLSIGLSVDAWFENQLQLSLFAFLSAYLQHIRITHSEHENEI